LWAHIILHDLNPVFLPLFQSVCFCVLLSGEMSFKMSDQH
jgi:hypothetical protein